MNKKIKDYLHLYLGCKIEIGGFQYVNDYTFLERLDSENYSFGWKDIKPILRPLSDMTEEEENDIEGEWGSYGLGEFHLVNALKNGVKYVKNLKDSFELTHYLLSKHFDLFGLIDAGLAIDATTINNQTIIK